jgi:hypothetical protein
MRTELSFAISVIRLRGSHHAAAGTTGRTACTRSATTRSGTAGTGSSTASTTSTARSTASTTGGRSASTTGCARGAASTTGGRSASTTGRAGRTRATRHGRSHRSSVAVGLHRIGGDARDVEATHAEDRRVDAARTGRGAARHCHARTREARLRTVGRWGRRRIAHAAGSHVATRAHRHIGAATRAGLHSEDGHARHAHVRSARHGAAATAAACAGGCAACTARTATIASHANRGRLHGLIAATSHDAHPKDQGSSNPPRSHVHTHQSHSIRRRSLRRRERLAQRTHQVNANCSPHPQRAHNCLAKSGYCRDRPQRQSEISGQKRQIWRRAAAATFRPRSSR